MIKLPDPAAPSRWKGDPALYSEDQVKQTIRDALEEAAKEFDRRAKPMSGWYEPDEPAQIIRALKETIR